MAEKKRPLRWRSDIGGDVNIASVVEKVKRKHAEFDALKHVKIKLAFRDPPQYKGDQLVLATTSSLAPKQRDLYGDDFIIEVAWGPWKEMSSKGRYRLMYHELKHVGVGVDDSGKPEKDDAKRVVIWVNDHDVVIETWRDEVKFFGCVSDHRGDVKHMSKYLTKGRWGKVPLPLED